MTALTGHTKRDTYKDLLQLSNNNGGLVAGINIVYDGKGTASPLGLSSAQISLNGTIWPTTLGTAGWALLTDGAGGSSWGSVATTATIASATMTFTNKSGLISQWTNDVPYATATNAMAFSNKTGNISQWTNDSGYLINGNQLIFQTIAAAGQPDVVAGTTSDTLTLVAGTNVTLAMNAGAKSVTINANAGGGSGLNDGTYGDITVSGVGTVMTIPASTVTYAKMQNVSATNKVLGRTTAGAGVVEEISCTITPGAVLSGSNTGDQTNISGNAATVTTNANLTGPITSVGNATSIASQTGTGTKFVVDTSPTLVTPVLGVATATSINKLTVTAPATGSTLTIADGQTLTVNGSATITNGTHSGTNTGDQNLFSTVAVSGQSNVVADGTSDTLTLVAGTNVTITTDAGTDSITINSTGGGGGLSDGDYGDVTVSGVGTVLTVDSVTVADAAADATTWPMLSRSVTGSNQVVSTDPGLTYDASANSLATTTFVGALTGNASTATALATARAIGGVNFDGTAAITPANITIANEATDTTCFPLFTTAATGDLPPKSNASLTFNSSTASLGCTTFVGALTGNVTGNVTGSSGSCTGNSATVTTNANLTGEVTSTGNAAVVDKTAITNQSADATPDPAADYVMTYDASATALKKVLLQHVGGWVKISSQAASASATIDFTTLSTMYRDFRIVLSHIVPETDTDALWIRTSTDGGSTYDSGATDYEWVRDAISTGAASSLTGSTGDTKMIAAPALGTSIREAISGEVCLHDPQSAAGTALTWRLAGKTSVAVFYHITGGGLRDASAGVNAIRFLMSTGNIASGTFTLYGLPA